MLESCIYSLHLNRTTEENTNESPQNMAGDCQHTKIKHAYKIHCTREENASTQNNSTIIKHANRFHAQLCQYTYYIIRTVLARSGLYSQSSDCFLAADSHMILDHCGTDLHQNNTAKIGFTLVLHCNVIYWN